MVSSNRTNRTCSITILLLLRCLLEAIRYVYVLVSFLGNHSRRSRLGSGIFLDDISKVPALPQPLLLFLQVVEYVD